MYVCIYVCVGVCIYYVCVLEGCPHTWEEDIRSLELEAQVSVNHLIYVLETKLRVSRRVASPPKCLTRSPALRQILTERKHVLKVGCIVGRPHQQELGISAQFGPEKGGEKWNVGKFSASTENKKQSLPNSGEAGAGQGGRPLTAIAAFWGAESLHRSKAAAWVVFSGKCLWTFSQAVHMLHCHQRTADVFSKDKESLSSYAQGPDERI